MTALEKFEQLYKEHAVKEILEFVEIIRNEYNELKAAHPNMNTMDIKGYLMNQYGKQIVKDTLVDQRNKQFFIDQQTKNSKKLFLDLEQKVQNKVGEITDMSNLVVTSGNNEYVLNGIIEGVKGKVEIKSVFVRGNIQKPHIRTLIKNIK